MQRYARSPGSRLYAVEVSGWDSRQSFFVENCDLLWNEDTGKQVALRRTLRKNTTVFVRLLQNGEASRSRPVVYDAELIGKTERGVPQFRLSAAVPRHKEAGSSVA
ncbi:MAG: hypothetical protein ACYDCG_19245 [Candidatus Acidiferrales bacterium]